MPHISKLARKFEREHTSQRGRDIKWLKFIDAKDMLEQLDIENISQASSDELVFSCPFPGHSNGDEKPSCYMNDGSKKPELTTVFKCHGCGRAGNAVSFLSEHQAITRQKASLELREHYAPGFRKPKYGSIQKEFDERRKELEASPIAKDIEILDWSLYKKFIMDWNDPHNDMAYKYMLDRGFESKNLEEWKIGYDRYSDRITIPIFNEDNNFVGVKARAWQQKRKPKYINLGDKEGFSERYGFLPYEKSSVVFGISRWGTVDSYVFVEGEIDVMSLAKMGIPAICTGGASMSETQAQIIKEYCDEVVLFLDQDLAGSNAVLGFDKEDGEHKRGIVEILEPFVRVKIVGKHAYDANDYLRNNKQGKVHKLIKEAEASFHLKLSSV